MCLQLLRIFVRASRDIQRHILGLAVESIDAANFLERAVDAIERKDSVAIGIANQQRPWRDQCREHRVIPAVGVHHKHAVAMPFDAAIDHMVLQIGNASHGYGDFDPFVRSGAPPTVSSTTAAAGYAKPGCIDFRSCLQIIECPNAIPGFHTGGRVPTRQPPPHTKAVCAVVNAFDLA
jgi:hypothetical protein